MIVLLGQVDLYGQMVVVDGMIFFLFVGCICVVGKMVVQICDEMVFSFVCYVKNLQFDVCVLLFCSQKVQVMGEVKQLGLFVVSDVLFMFVDVILCLGGLIVEVDLQCVCLMCDGKLYMFDVNGVFDCGEVKQNVMLQLGDIVNVLDCSDSCVFIMGEVKMLVMVLMFKGWLIIVDVLIVGGGIFDIDVNLCKIYVMCGMCDNLMKFEVFCFDMMQFDVLMLLSCFLF